MLLDQIKQQLDTPLHHCRVTIINPVASISKHKVNVQNNMQVTVFKTRLPYEANHTKHAYPDIH